MGSADDGISNFEKKLQAVRRKSPNPTVGALNAAGSADMCHK
jgi:hypothetical protein